MPYYGSSGSAITVKEEGVALTTAASSLDFAGAGVVATGTGVDKLITIAGASGGGGSVAHSYVGYNTVGGTVEDAVANRHIAKQVTLAAECVVASVAAYVRVDTGPDTSGFGVGVWSDNAGAVGNLIAFNMPRGAGSSGSPGAPFVIVASAPRWIDVPLGVYLPAGTYWVGILTFALGSGGNRLNIYYDASGTDRRFDSADSYIADGAVAAQTDTTRKYSIRASVLAQGGASDPIATQFGTPDTAYEFATTSFTGLTAMGTLDSESMHGTVLGHYYASDNDAAQAGRYAAVSAPFTAIVRVSDAALRANYQYVGMFCGVATPGKMVWLGTGWADGGVVKTFTFATPTDASPGSPGVLQAPPASEAFGGSYLAIVATSNTNISYYWSRNGVLWFTILSAHDNSMTVGAVGMSIGVYGSGPAVAGAYDFMRIWNSVLTIPGT